MSSLSFTDFYGSAILLNGKPAPGDRFRSWTPLVRTIGAYPVGLGNGITYGWDHRVDFGVELTLEHIPMSQLGIVQRLLLCLMQGQNDPVLDTGVVLVETGDRDGHSYQCRLWPESTPPSATASASAARTIHWL